MNPKDRKAKTEMKPKPKTPNLPAATPAPAPALEWWPVDRPVPYARNPRRNDGAVDALAASIREFGFRSPVLVDAAGVVIAGHTRLKAARKLGLREVPVLVCADLPPEKVAALRLADNKTAELAEWDTPALDAELAELAEAGVDMEQFGFALSVAQTDGEAHEIDPSEIFDAGVSLVVECDGDADAEEKLRIATEEMGWKAKLSTL